MPYGESAFGKEQAVDTTNFVWTKSYFGTTVLDPIAGIVLAAMCVGILFLPRKYACWPMIIIACFISQAQRISIASLDFPFLRIITCFAILRVMIRGEFQSFKFNRLDYAVIAFMGIRTIYSFLHITKSVSATGVALCGDTLDAWGQYFFFRCLVSDYEDFKNLTYGFMIFAIPNAITMIIEATTLHNPYAFMGGVSDVTRSRDDTLRCMNAYSHPILAGCFWAVLLPYMGAMIKQRGRIKIFPFFGIIAASIIIVLSGSSSPIAGAGLAFLGGCAFLFRRQMKLIRWVTFLTVAAAQVMSNSPVWKVFARVKIVGGSTGYYRFKLIDQFIRHAPDWLLAGSAKGTSTWDVPMFDIVNYYVVLGLGGGLVFIILIVWLLIESYRNAGVGMRSAAGDTEQQLMSWATGVSVFVHMMTFLAVTYYGQITMVWFMSLALTGIASRSPARRGYSPLTGWHSDPLVRLARPRFAQRQPVRLRHGF